MRALTCLDHAAKADLEGDHARASAARTVATHLLEAAIAEHGAGGDVEQWCHLATAHRQRQDLDAAVDAGRRAVQLGEMRGDVSFDAHFNLGFDLAASGAAAEDVAQCFGSALKVASAAGGRDGVPLSDRKAAHKALGASLAACQLPGGVGDDPAHPWRKRFTWTPKAKAAKRT